MSAPPDRPKVYHITHVDNLPAILAEGALLSDRAMIARSGPAQPIGMTDIKQRRLHRIHVPCHDGTTVGDYVPFYFCPRSIMLYLLHRGNHAELTYRGGQESILHLHADLAQVVRWAEEHRVRWCFSLANAGAYATEFRNRWSDLDELNWAAIAAADFRAPDIKEGKQAEFLLEGRFPLDLVEGIGVPSDGIRHRVESALAQASRSTATAVKRSWYF